MFSSWRWVGWIYGLAGIAVATAFWAIFRDHPAEHPRVNAEERALLAEGREGIPVKSPPQSFPWKAVFTSRSLWFASLYQTVRGGVHVWFDAAVMFVFLLLVARMLEQRARGIASAQVDALARARPALATREPTHLTLR